jgi:hypothetical protein
MSRRAPSFSPAFWEEVRRRCDEAEAHPERLLTPEEFFRGVQEMIDHEKAKRLIERNRKDTQQGDET